MGGDGFPPQPQQKSAHKALSPKLAWGRGLGEGENAQQANPQGRRPTLNARALTITAALAVSLLTLLHDRPDFGLLFGSIQVAGPAILYGAAGAILGPANLDPKTSVALCEAARAGRVAETFAAQRRLLSLSRLLTLGSPIACLKTALELMGVCGATVTRPFQPLSATARDQVAAILREHELM